MPRFRSLSAALLLAATLPAYAHPGHQPASAGLIAGLIHPLLGADHLLAMLMVGIWAAQLGGRARWLLPASFIALMGIGAAAAMLGHAPPRIDAGIAASLLVFGLLVALRGRLPLPAALTLTAVFALFHGAAHGLELPVLARPGAYALGFLGATAALHAAGVALGISARRGAGAGLWLACS